MTLPRGALVAASRRAPVAVVLVMACALTAVGIRPTTGSAATAGVAPNPPTNVTATSGPGQVTLRWAAPFYTNGTITGYVVTPVIGTAAQTPVTFASTATTETVSGLANGTTYTFTVAAVNANGTSAPSAPSAPLAVGAPGSPPFPSAASGDGQATVSWWPPSPNASPITGSTITPVRDGIAQPAQTFVSSARSQIVGGLTNGSRYTFAVAASNASGTGAASSTAAIVVGAPGPPTTVTAAPANGQATVTWSAPSNPNGAQVTGYVVTPYVGFTAQPAQAFASAATSQTVTGLVNGTGYTFAVAATNARGLGVGSAVSPPATVGAPGAPGGAAAVPGNGQATVSWAAPANTNGASVNGYVVTPYIGPTAQPARAFPSTATSQVVAGLVNGTGYTFTVAATNTRGTGPMSAPSPAVTIGAAGSVPSAPAPPTVGPGSGAVNVAWVAPGANGSPITGYVVTPWRGATALPSATFPGSSTGGTVWWLTNGDSLTFTVSAVNGIGAGPSSAHSAPVTVGSPNPPSGATADSGAGQVALRWGAPFFSNGPITGYVVTPYIGPTAQPPRTFASPATTQAVAGLTNGTTYTFVVAAVNANGVGPASTPTAPVTVGAPGPPPFPSAVAGDGQATLSWLPPVANASPVTGSVVTASLDGVPQPPVTFSSGTTRQTMTGLVNGGRYTFAIAASNASGVGPANSTAPVVVGAPGLPGVAGAEPGNGQATLSWAAPTTTNGAPITGYVVTPYIANAAQAPQTFPSPAVTATVTGLRNATTYTFSVAAANGRGVGPGSGLSPPVTIGSPVAPSGVGAVPGNGQATVSWTPPVSSNGSAITRYAVTPYAGTTALATQTFPSPATTQTLSGLANGTSYTFAVAAGNANGDGPQSPRSAPTPVGAPGVMMAPTAVAGVGQATVAWTAPAPNGAPITGYTVTPYLGSRPMAAVVFASTATTQTLTGLENGVAYSFVVAATNADGLGPWSPPSVSVTPGGSPAPPEPPVADPGNGQATLSWAAPPANGSPVTGYVVTPWIGATAQPARAFASAATTQVVTGLSNATSYTFTVQASNARGTSSASPRSSAIVVGAPAAPGSVMAAPGNGQATVSWVAPVDNGSAVTGYVVTPWSGGVAQTPVSTGAITTTTITGLNNATPYFFTVAAVNANGMGPRSTPSPTVVVGAPSAPGAPNASLVNGAVTLTWTAPSVNGAAVTGYVVTPYVGASAQTPFTFNALTTQTLSGLGTGVTYTFTVAARSSAGTGSESAASNPVTTAHWFCEAGPPRTSEDFRAALNHHDQRWEGGDGANAVALPDGRVLWLFGDTLYGAVQPDGSLTVGWGMAHGSALVQSGACFDPFYSAFTTAPTSLVPTGLAAGFYWPGEAWVSPDGGRLNVMVSHVRQVGTTSAFEGIDNGIAVFNLPDLSFVRIDTLPPPPPPATTAYWRGVTHQEPGDGYVYLSDVEAFAHYAVRFPATTTDFTTATGWEYWTGAGWSLVPTDIGPMAVTSPPFVGMPVQKTSTGHVSAATGFGPDTGFIVGWGAPTPVGAWTPLGRLAVAPAAGGISSTYGGHPVLLSGADPLVVWSVSPSVSGNVNGAAIGVAALPP